MIEVDEDNGSVRVTYKSEEGQASAVVVGETVESVDSRREEIVDIHNLRDKI